MSSPKNSAKSRAISTPRAVSGGSLKSLAARRGGDRSPIRQPRRIGCINNLFLLFFYLFLGFGGDRAKQRANRGPRVRQAPRGRPRAPKGSREARGPGRGGQHYGECEGRRARTLIENFNRNIRNLLMFY